MVLVILLYFRATTKIFVVSGYRLLAYFTAGKITPGEEVLIIFPWINVRKIHMPIVVQPLLQRSATKDSEKVRKVWKTRY